MIQRYSGAIALYTLSFRGKLISLPSLVTAGRLVINRQSATFAALCELIRARNTLVHNKPFFDALEAEDIEGGISLKFPAKMLTNQPFTFGEGKCRKFRMALIEFTRQIHDGDPAKEFDPEALQPSDLLKLAGDVK